MFHCCESILIFVYKYASKVWYRFCNPQSSREQKDIHISSPATSHLKMFSAPTAPRGKESLSLASCTQAHYFYLRVQLELCQVIPHQACCDVDALKRKQETQKHKQPVVRKTRAIKSKSSSSLWCQIAKSRVPERRLLGRLRCVSLSRIHVIPLSPHRAQGQKCCVPRDIKKGASHFIHPPFSSAVQILFLIVFRCQKLLAYEFKALVLSCSLRFLLSPKHGGHRAKTRRKSVWNTPVCVREL